MKILIAGQSRAVCLHLPLGLICSRPVAALLAGCLRHQTALTDGSQEATGRTALITTAQMHSLLKAIKRSQQTLQNAGLPLMNLEEHNGHRIVITL